MKTSCLIEPPSVRYVKIPDHFREICRDNKCSGALMVVFRYLADKYDETTWIEHSIDQFVDDIRGLFERRKVIESLAEMVEDGLIERQERPGQTPLWRLCVDAVNERIFGLEVMQKCMGTHAEMHGGSCKSARVDENTPYICSTNNKDNNKDALSRDQLPGEDDDLGLEMYGDGWVVNTASTLRTRITVTTKFRGQLRVQLDGAHPQAAERRLEVRQLLNRLSGGDGTADLKRLIEGYEKGWKSQPPRQKTSSPPGSRANSARPGKGGDGYWDRVAAAQDRAFQRFMEKDDDEG